MGRVFTPFSLRWAAQGRFAAMRSGRLIPAAVLGFLFSISSAQAANPKVGALIKEGDRLYKENKYREAAEALKKAYDLEPAGVLLYNIGRAYDQAGELKIALDYYRQFVGQEGSDPTLVKKANLAMDRLRTLVAKDEAGRQVNDAEKKRLEDEARIAKEKAASETEKSRLQKEAYEAKEKAAVAAAQSKTGARLAGGLVVTGLAVVALGSGIAFGVLAGTSKTQFKAATTVADKQKFDVSYVTAGAAAIAAILLFPKGGSEPPKAVEVVFAPAPGGAYAGLQGSF
jgi:tetratricopeptide (TPR) repeat protein